MLQSIIISQHQSFLQKIPSLSSLKNSQLQNHFSSQLSAIKNQIQTMSDGSILLNKQFNITGLNQHIIQRWGLYFQYLDQLPTQFDVVYNQLEKQCFAPNDQILCFINDQRLFQQIHCRKKIGLDLLKIGDVPQQCRNEQILYVKQMFKLFRLKPLSIISAFSLAYDSYKVISEKEAVKKIYLTILNFQSNYLIAKPTDIDKFVLIQGTVIKIGQIKSQISSIQFECSKCHQKFIKYLHHGIYSLPKKCANNNCLYFVFKPNPQKINVTHYQRLVIRQNQNIEKENEYLKIHCEKQIGSVMIGSDIVVSGILKAIKTRQNYNKGISNSILYLNSIVSYSKIVKQISFQNNYIKQMINNKYILYSMIKSCCNELIGFQIIKAAILISLVQIKPLKKQGKTNINLLIIGDPKIGKTKIIQFFKSIFDDGISNNFLPMFSKQNNLQAGYIVSQKSNLAFIDDLDKNHLNLQTLFQILSLGQTYICKNKMFRKIKKQISCVASINVTSNRLKYILIIRGNRSLKQSLNIPLSLFSLFDLNVLMFDNPNMKRDKTLSQYILKINSNNKRKMINDIVQQYNNCQEKLQFQSFLKELNYYCSLKLQTYTKDQIRTYFQYLKSIQTPTLSLEAAQIFKHFFITLKQNSFSDSIFITSKHLQTMICLSQKYAKFIGKNQVEKSDAKFIIKLYQEIIFSFLNQYLIGSNHLERQINKQQKKQIKQPKINKNDIGSLSLPKQTKFFLQKLRESIDQNQDKIFQYSELQNVAKGYGLNVGDFHNFIQSLNLKGILLFKGKKTYQLID